MLRVKAHAKINLSLKILGRRPDGFHEIESVMQSVSLCDIVTLTPIDRGIEVSTNNLKLPVDSRNLAYKAAELFFSHKSGGVKIHIEKNIPVAAGLAGGSADAAAVLFGLNQIMTGDRRLATRDLLALGAEIGSDVPFCLTGGNCTVRGRGELVTRNPMTVNRSYIIVVPEVEVSTKWAYSSYDLDFARGQMSNESRNNLESVVIRKYPVIQKIKERLLSLGCAFAQMSGSGPGVFGFPGDERILGEVKKEFARSFLVTSVEDGVEEILA